MQEEMGGANFFPSIQCLVDPIAYPLFDNPAENIISLCNHRPIPPYSHLLSLHCCAEWKRRCCWWCLSPTHGPSCYMNSIVKNLKNCVSMAAFWIRGLKARPQSLISWQTPFELSGLHSSEGLGMWDVGGVLSAGWLFFSAPLHVGNPLWGGTFPLRFCFVRRKNRNSRVCFSFMLHVKCFSIGVFRLCGMWSVFNHR